jgi:hypothetical protein
MKRPFLFVLLTLVGLHAPVHAQQPGKGAKTTLAWQGDWRWKDPHAPEASHYLRLKGSLAKPSGEYAGNETAEGIVYFKVAVTQLKITAKNEVSFMIGPHALTRTPLTLSAKNLSADAPQAEGYSGVNFRFTGQLNGKVLTLNCKADDDMSCPAATMRFERMR